jgi:hypothetical protein
MNSTMYGHSVSVIDIRGDPLFLLAQSEIYHFQIASCLEHKVLVMLCEIRKKSEK